MRVVTLDVGDRAWRQAWRQAWWQSVQEWAASVGWGTAA